MKLFTSVEAVMLILASAFAEESCPSNQIYNFCGSYCPRNCANKDVSLILCPQVCVPGCFCISGYYKNAIGNCVTAEACNSSLELISTMSSMHLSTSHIGTRSVMPYTYLTLLATTEYTVSSSDDFQPTVGTYDNNPHHVSCSAATCIFESLETTQLNDSQVGLTLTLSLSIFGTVCGFLLFAIVTVMIVILCRKKHKQENSSVMYTDKQECPTPLSHLALNNEQLDLLENMAYQESSPSTHPLQ